MKIRPVNVANIIANSNSQEEWVSRALIIISSRLDDLINAHNEQDELEDTYF